MIMLEKLTWHFYKGLDIFCLYDIFVIQAFFMDKLPLQDCEERFRNDIFVKKEYDFGIPQKSSMVVVDIGAHVGLFSEYIYPKTKLIHAYEPSEGNMIRLKNRCLNQRLNHVVVHPVGVSATWGVRSLYSNGIDGDFSIRYKNENFVNIPTITIGDIFTENNLDYVDLIKIDVEGAEEEILNSESFAMYAKNIGSIVGELHSDVDIFKLRDRLASLGYKFRNINNIFSAIYG